MYQVEQGATSRYATSRPMVCVVMPTYNEVENLPSSIGEPGTCAGATSIWL